MALKERGWRGMSIKLARQAHLNVNVRFWIGNFFLAHRLNEPACRLGAERFARAVRGENQCHRMLAANLSEDQSRVLPCPMPHKLLQCARHRPTGQQYILFTTCSVGVWFVSCESAGRVKLS